MGSIALSRVVGSIAVALVAPAGAAPLSEALWRDWLAPRAGEFAALSLLPADSSLATTEYKLNLLDSAEGDVLVAEGHLADHQGGGVVVRVAGRVDYRDVHPVRSGG